MNKNLLSSAAIAVLVVVSGRPALGQEDGAVMHEQPGVATQVQIGQETLQIKLKGDDLPLFTVVSMFFIDAARYVQETESAHKKFLSKLGVEHGSPAEEFLAETSKRAFEVIVTPDFDLSLVDKEDEYRRYQFEVATRKARDLGKLYQGLLDGLDEAGLDSNKIVEYCEHEVRPNSSVSYTPDSHDVYMAVIAEFENQLTNHRQLLKKEE